MIRERSPELYGKQDITVTKRNPDIKEVLTGKHTKN